MSAIPAIDHNQTYGSFTLPETDTDTDKNGNLHQFRWKHFQNIITEPNSIGIGISLGLDVGLGQRKHAIRGQLDLSAVKIIL